MIVDKETKKEAVIEKNNCSSADRRIQTLKSDSLEFQLFQPFPHLLAVKPYMRKSFWTSIFSYVKLGQNPLHRHTMN
jgi:hypothetical protein